MKDDQILKDNEALIDDPKAPQEDLVITQVKARVENEELDAMEAVGTEESKQPAASAVQNMPLKVTNVLPKFSNLAPTKSSNEPLPVHNVQHDIDPILKSQLPNPPAHNANLSEYNMQKQ
ncbi:hypothetical protein CsSME_00014483 [Camellia sinensis var. sinensis]